MLRERKKRQPAFTKPRVVFRGHFFTAEQWTAKYPSGTRKIFERILRVPSVAVLPFDRRGRLLLIREYREALGSSRLTIPGGRADQERSPRVAAQRELREETGLRARRLRLFLKSSPKGYLHWPRYLYIAQDLTPDPLPQDEGEDIKIIPTSLKKAYEMCLDGTVQLEFVALGIIRLFHERKKWLKR